MTDDIEELPECDDSPERGMDHPDDPLTAEEAAEGRSLYLVVDDTDDDSTGLDPEPEAGEDS